MGKQLLDIILMIFTNQNLLSQFLGKGILTKARDLKWNAAEVSLALVYLLAKNHRFCRWVLNLKKKFKMLYKNLMKNLKKLKKFKI